MNKKVILMILDGWGITQNERVSAIWNAKTPYIDALYKKYPHATLRTDGRHVGLPDGQMGNSEVGHINLGAGRVIHQNLTKINIDVKEKTLEQKKILMNTYRDAMAHDKDVHLLGLVSDGGVHAHIDHLKGLLEVASTIGLKKVFLHAFTDGRDCDPKSGVSFIDAIQRHMKATTGKLASITGRYYAMDRDLRWERISKAYQAIVHGKGYLSNDAIKSLEESYKKNTTDEFIAPIIMLDPKGNPIARVKEGDVVLFFNYRTDRGRQLTNALSQNDFPEYGMKKLNLNYTTMTLYDKTFQKICAIYENENLKDTLGEVLSREGKKQIRISETEKYPHVTFFFSGGRETLFDGEKRILCNSPKVATYDLKPEMSAFEIKNSLCEELKKKETNFICLNFANGDIVGHTGMMNAAIKACETVDKCVKEVIETGLKNDYTTLLIADHGNCETMIHENGSPHTFHTMNPVPIIITDRSLKKIENGILANVAPTILKLMGLPQPNIMTEKPLI